MNTLDNEIYSYEGGGDAAGEAKETEPPPSLRISRVETPKTMSLLKNFRDSEISAVILPGDHNNSPHVPSCEGGGDAASEEDKEEESLPSALGSVDADLGDSKPSENT